MDKTVSPFYDLRHADPETITAREKILRAAVILFNAGGIHTTGIDRIISESKVAKMTFYKHFPSKVALIQAYLDHKEQMRLLSIKKHSEKTKDPLKQILSIFDSLEEWFSEPDFRGCPFIRGLSDFADDKNSPLYKQLEAHFEIYKDFCRTRLLEITTPAKAKSILPILGTLFTGSIVMALASNDPKIARVNKKIAQTIIETA